MKEEAYIAFLKLKATTWGTPRSTKTLAILVLSGIASRTTSTYKRRPSVGRSVDFSFSVSMYSMSPFSPSMQSASSFTTSLDKWSTRHPKSLIYVKRPRVRMSNLTLITLFCFVIPSFILTLKSFRCFVKVPTILKSL